MDYDYEELELKQDYSFIQGDLVNDMRRQRKQDEGKDNDLNVDQVTSVNILSEYLILLYVHI